MIIFGTSDTMPGKFDPGVIPGIRKLLLFNLSSLNDAGERLPHLMPNPLPSLMEMEANSEKDFDIAYMSYIMANDYAFVNMMSIMYPIYENSDLLVYILVGKDPYRNSITESLIKLIQQRYGYECNYINAIEDIPYVRDSSMTIFGLQNFDQDKERYVYLTGTPCPVME